MAQRRRMEDPVGDVSNDGALGFFLQKAAGELTKLYSLALDKEIAFNAGTRYAYIKVYEWIQLQLQDGKSVTAADMSAYLQNKLNQLDEDILNMQQLASANKSHVEDNMLDTQQQLEPLANGTKSGPSGDINGTVCASQNQEMDVNY